MWYFRLLHRLGRVLNRLATSKPETKFRVLRFWCGCRCEAVTEISDQGMPVQEAFQWVFGHNVLLNMTFKKGPA